MGWHSRGYLPHFDEAGTIQSITFRLGDSLPGDVLARLRDACPEDDAERWRRIEAWLEAGHGSCLLREHGAGIEAVLLARDGTDCRLFAWAVMPNHVHVLIESESPVEVIVQAWKSVSAHRIGSGRQWQREYWDRWIRDQCHFDRVRAYIEANPVEAWLRIPTPGPGPAPPGSAGAPAGPGQWEAADQRGAATSAVPPRLAGGACHGRRGRRRSQGVFPPRGRRARVPPMADPVADFIAGTIRWPRPDCQLARQGAPAPPPAGAMGGWSVANETPSPRIAPAGAGAGVPRRPR